MITKKILVSLSVIAAVAAIAVGGTVAYFSDTETSTGNTFTAGDLDLKIDSECTYNGQVQKFCTWLEKDLTEGDLFFNFADIKPGDSGEDTISLHVNSNDACGFVKIAKTSDYDNSCTEPESAPDAEPNCVPDNLETVDVNESGLGELDNATEFMIWADVCSAPGVTGAPAAVPGDNIYQEGCDQLLTQGTLDGDKYWGIGKLVGDSTAYYGISWKVDPLTGNEAQSDSFSADVQFSVEQYRNQYPKPNYPGSTDNYGCPVGDIAD